MGYVCMLLVPEANDRTKHMIYNEMGIYILYIYIYIHCTYIYIYIIYIYMTNKEEHPLDSCRGNQVGNGYWVLDTRYKLVKCLIYLRQSPTGTLPF